MTASGRSTSQSRAEPEDVPLGASSLDFHSRLQSPNYERVVDKSDGKERRRLRRQERFAATKREVEDLRDAILGRRLSLRESRTALGRQHSRIRQLEAQLLKELRNLWEIQTVADNTHMNQIYEEIVEASDQMGPGEEEFREKEDDLGVMEFKLGKLEDRLYNYIRFADPNIHLQTDYMSSSSDASSVPSPSTGVLLDEPEQSPLNRYLSRYGDANIIKERLAELEMQRSEYAEQEEERDVLGVPLYQPNVEFLAAFDRVYDQHLTELHTIEDDLAILGHEAGLAPQTSSHDASPPARPTSPKSYHEPDDRGLRSSDGLERRRSDSDLFGISNDPVSARRRINQWILDRLIDSPIERARHKAILESPFLNDKDWLALILEHWKKDRLAISPESSGQNTSKITMSPEDRRPNVSSTSNFPDPLAGTVDATNAAFGDSAEASLILSGLNTEDFYPHLPKVPPNPRSESSMSWSLSFDEKENDFLEYPGFRDRQ
ncbi:MAG: hypothetical protein Q9195_004228 [Heterodermia aff. obscurata]